MSVTVSFTSQPKPPADIASFVVQRSDRAATGTIALSGDVDDTTNIITITFDAPAPAVGELAGDYLIAGDVSYVIETNTASTITIDEDESITAIKSLSFPLSVIVIDDMAEYSDFTDLGTVSPSITTWDSTYQHQYIDSTGTNFDWYKVIPTNTAGVEGTVSEAFRASNVTTSSYSIPTRTTPKDRLWGLIGSTMEFEIEVTVANEVVDPVDNVVYCYPTSSPAITGGSYETLETITMIRVSKGRYKGSWTVDSSLSPGDEYTAIYKANFHGLYESATSNLVEFASEYFQLRNVPDTISGKMGKYTTVDELRKAFQNIDSFITDEHSTDINARNEFIYWHIGEAADILDEQLAMHQLRGNSADRKEFVRCYAIMSIIMSSKGQDGSATDDKNLDRWEKRFQRVADQMHAEGDFQGIPMGRG